jgi:hypothetical protein
MSTINIPHLSTSAKMSAPLEGVAHYRGCNKLCRQGARLYRQGNPTTSEICINTIKGLKKAGQAYQEKGGSQLVPKDQRGLRQTRAERDGSIASFLRQLCRKRKGNTGIHFMSLRQSRTTFLRRISCDCVKLRKQNGLLILRIVFGLLVTRLGLPLPPVAPTLDGFLLFASTCLSSLAVGSWPTPLQSRR